MNDGLTLDTVDGRARYASQPLPLALRSHRFAARVIDGFIIGIPVTLIERSNWGSLAAADDAPIVDIVLFTLTLLAIGMIYEVALVAVKGQTLGKMLMGITVLRADNGILPGWRRSFKRCALPYLLLLILFLGFLCYLSPLWGRNRQGWHDRFAGTYVLTTGPAPPYTSTRSTPAQGSR